MRKMTESKAVESSLFRGKLQFLAKRFCFIYFYLFVYLSSAAVYSLNICIDRSLFLKADVFEFSELLSYVSGYLETNLRELAISKNLSGFFRIRIPPPENLKQQVKELRINYWHPKLEICPESIHSHPQYFESIVICGGYEHEMFSLSVMNGEIPHSGSDLTTQDETHIGSTSSMTNAGKMDSPGGLLNAVGWGGRSIHKIDDVNHEEKLKVYRIYKKNGENSFYRYLESVNLASDRVEKVNFGSVYSFPTSLIHRILKADPYTLTFNVVFHSESNDTYFDVFKSDHFIEQDLHLDKCFLMPAESVEIISEIMVILNTAH